MQTVLTLSYYLRGWRELVVSKWQYRCFYMLEIHVQWTLGGSFLAGSGEGSVAEIGMLLYLLAELAGTGRTVAYL